MRGYDYLTLDVFTDRLFGGNQLAVFPDGAGLDTRTMQAIARELNLSETAFVLPFDGAAHWPLRIFTPAMELPFAGHPTIGAAIAMVELGRVDVRAGLVFNEPAGPVPVRFDVSGKGPIVATLASPRVPEALARPPLPDVLARIIGLPVADLGPGPASAFSAGVPFTFVPVRDRSALARVAVDLGAWREHLSAGPAPHLLVFTMADWPDGREVDARMFAPLMGISEDPATGGAAAALAALLAKQQGLREGERVWTIRQGEDMGRPSRIVLKAVAIGGKIVSVEVGGQAVLVGRGTLQLPD
jgi:trans-2,3-dihydro-3-hydroxyanthranilate isomerase